MEAIYEKGKLRAIFIERKYLQGKIKFNTAIKQLKELIYQENNQRI